MSRIITKEYAEKIRDKLCDKKPHKTSGGHDVYPVRYNGQVVGQVSIRRGSEKDKGHDFIPPALNITPHFAKEIGICNKNLDDYLDNLRTRDLLPIEQEALLAPKVKRPWEKDWAELQASTEPDPPDGDSSE
jgi:hypothetical protein